jgi:hypothetical protein
MILYTAVSSVVIRLYTSRRADRPAMQTIGFTSSSTSSSDSEEKMTCCYSALENERALVVTSVAEARDTPVVPMRCGSCPGMEKIRDNGIAQEQSRSTGTTLIESACSPLRMQRRSLSVDLECCATCTRCCERVYWKQMGAFCRNRMPLASSAPPRIRGWSAHCSSWRTACRRITLVDLVHHPPEKAASVGRCGARGTTPEQHREPLQYCLLCERVSSLNHFANRTSPILR